MSAVPLPPRVRAEPDPGPGRQLSSQPDSGPGEAGRVVGRAAELDEVWRAIQSRGDTLISGDAGIGKTTVIRAVRDRAMANGWFSITGHCLGEGGQGLSYLPFTEIFQRVALVLPDVAQELVAAHPSLGRLIPSARENGPAASGLRAASTDRSDFVEAVLAGIEMIAARQPLLLILEDVHWADQSSRDLITMLLSRGFTHPVSVVVTYRSDDVHRRHPLRPTLAQWARIRHLHRLELKGLADSAIEQIVRTDSVRERDLDADDVAAVVSRAEGNAFIAEELAAAAGLPLADTDLSRILLARIDELDPAAVAIVRQLSVAGGTVSHALLLAVGQLTEPPLTVDEVEGAVRSAIDHHVLVRRGESDYLFRHALLGEAIRLDLLPGERRRAHAAYVQALRADESLGTRADLATHAEAIGDRATAFGARVQAGQLALQLAGPEEALAHFEAAIDLAPPDLTGTSQLLDDAVIGAAEAAVASGRPARAGALLRERLTTLPVCGHDDTCGARSSLLAALARALILSESGDERTDVVAIAREALECAPEDGPLRAQLLLVLADALLFVEAADAVQVLDEAELLGADLGLLGIVAAARTLRARASEIFGDRSASLAALEQVVASAGEETDLLVRLRAHYSLGVILLTSGQRSAAQVVLADGWTLAQRHGRPWTPYATECLLLSIVAAYEAGEWDRALELASGQADAPEPARSVLTAFGLYVTAARGEAAAIELLPSLRDAWSLDGVIAVACAHVAIEAYGWAGEIDSAVAMYDSATRFIVNLWGNPTPMCLVALGAQLLGHVPADAADPALVERVFAAGLGAEQAMERSGRQSLESTAWGHRLRAEKATLSGVGGAELIDLRRKALDATTAYGDRYETARCQWRLAQALAAATTPDADREARELRAAAIEQATALGAAPLLRALGAPVGWSSPTSDGLALTAREVEVLQLVSEGLSNGQIGKRLFISPKTASVHVSNILAKLGVAGRGEAAAVGRRAGLIS